MSHQIPQERFDEEDPHHVEDYEIILFDGPCNLCNQTVLWIIERDPKKRFRFASLESRLGQSLLQRICGDSKVPDSIVFVEPNCRAHFRSTAVIQIAKRLGFPWFLLVAFLVVPRTIRDIGYRWVARNRYRWFGKNDQCMIPTAELKSRFLDLDPSTN